MPKKKSQKLANITDFLFEVGMLARVPRSGFHFLGNNEQSVAEHINRAAYIGYVLAQISDEKVDAGKVMKMCLLHDLAEARTSDLNWTNQKYVVSDEASALQDMARGLPFGPDILETIEEYEDRKSLESKLAKDADSLELLLVLKEMIDIGHQKASTWIPPLLKRLLTPTGKKLAKQILETESDHWWYADKEDEWWVSRKRKKKHTL